jgi:hypothetical protein
MKKAKKKKSAVRKPNRAKKASTASAEAEGVISGGLVEKQPQQKEQAAVAQHMFLHDDDTWAKAYFDQSDLHFLEREVFG